METWIFFGGRWKVLSDRWTASLLLLSALAAGMTGFLSGVVLMELHYEGRITEIEQRISALKPFVEQV